MNGDGPVIIAGAGVWITTGEIVWTLVGVGVAGDATIPLPVFCSVIRLTALPAPPLLSRSETTKFPAMAGSYCAVPEELIRDSVPMVRSYR